MPKQGRVTFTRMEEVLFGVDAASAVAEQAQRLDARRVLLMVSGTLNRDTDEIERVRSALGERCVAVFDQMPSHTPRRAVIAAADLARDIRTDLIVTVGGSSVTDGAKAVQLCLAGDIRTADAMDVFRRVDAGAAPPRSYLPLIRQISVPTTLSAAEFSPTSAVTDERFKKKELFFHPDLVPRTTVLDPSITVHTPEWLFLSSGVRAIDHCVEGICSAESNSFGDAHALRGLALLASGLPRIKANPGDLDARLDCQIGSWLSMGAVTAGVPMGASHGIGYVLGAVFGVPHGYTSCIMLPAVMQWNKPANAERQAMVATAMGKGDEDASVLLKRLINGLGLPIGLSDVKIAPKDFDAIAAQSMKTPWVPRNPRPIERPSQICEILDLAK